jgi:hypothetical protein
MKPRLYRFRKQRKFVQPPQKLKPDRVDDTQQYYVHGKKATDLEYFFATALDKFEHDYIFIYYFSTPFTVPGQEKQIDFMVDDDYPYEIDGGYAHKSAQQKAEDLVRDQVMNEFLRKIGKKDITRVKETLVDTQEKANAFVEQYV